MKISYTLTDFLDKQKIYNKNFRYMYKLNLLIVEDLHLYEPKRRLEHIIKANQIVNLYEMQKEDILKMGLYELDCYSGFLVSKEELNAYTIPINIIEHSYSKENNFDMEGIEIRKKGHLFPIYRTPKLLHDAKKLHYICVDSILKKMFINCGEIVLNSNMNTVLQNIKQFDKLLIETNSAELCVQIKEYLESVYKKMLEIEKKENKVKTSKSYFELDISNLNENEFLKDLKIKKEIWDMM